ncbi:hypothetical protein JW905_05440 [bacterium]|nr:hypothetical protein [candidate division CSSED10-310 bacterium]
MKLSSIVIILCCAWLCLTPAGLCNPPIYISFLWHMHQPVYVPYDEAITIVQNNGPVGGPGFSFSLHEMWASKGGPYRTWPIDAVETGMNAGLPHLGAQVNFTGSLMESLGNLEYHDWNGGYYNNWKYRWQQGASWRTSLGNTRVEIIGFPFHHPIAGLVPVEDLELQIEMHRRLYLDNFGGTYSSGCFPAETSFHERSIPALVEAGMQWVLVDNIHLNRTLTDYPWTGNSGVVEPNGADSSGVTLQQMDPGSQWLNLNGLWAPEAVSPWAYRPHHIAWTDPATGLDSTIVAIPGACYMANEDARGGFGALNYEGVMSQLEASNTDDDHPLLVVLHHDGENYGAGTDSYYHSNFQNFVNWAQANPNRFVPTTIQDYMDMFPPDTNDIVRVEPGGWIGSGCLDPEFRFWLADPDPFPQGYSPDWNSWSVLTAAHNWVHTADSIQHWGAIGDILYNNGNQTARAFHDYLCAQASDYEYWEGGPDQLIWNSNAVRGCNLAVEHAGGVVSGGNDTVGPSIFKPQRQPYNPGGMEWHEQQPSDFTVWTFIYDLSGIAWAKVNYRIDPDGAVGPENRVYAGGAWNEAFMTGETRPSQSAVQPYYQADYYSAVIAGQTQVLVDYYVEAQDDLGNVARSEICHVFVGAFSGPDESVTWTPSYPTRDQIITITVHEPGQGGWLHWGVNAVGTDWTQPDAGYWPAGTTLFGGTGPAVETPLDGPGPHGDYQVQVGPFNQSQIVHTIDFVIHFQDDSWDNNEGQDYHIAIWETPPPATATPTPRPSATATPSHTPPPWATLTPTPTSGFSPSATPTLVPMTDITIDLRLNQPWFTAGEWFSLDLSVVNGSPVGVAADQYVVLEAYGQYYFHPGWWSYPTSTQVFITGGAVYSDRLLDFRLPDDLPRAAPFYFYSALLSRGSGVLLSNFEMEVFGFY